MKKKLLALVSNCLVVIIVLCCSSMTAFAVGTESEVVFPPADGIDIGGDSQETGIEPAAFWYSKYSYNSPAFGVGVYFNGGQSFSCRSSRSPYLEKANHSKVKNSNPAYYRVSYQMIYSSTGAVRKGVYFGGDITNLKVEFDVKETNSFKFYIAGDSSNTYCASGVLRY